MALDRAFYTPTITVDQEKYDKLIIMSSRYREMTKNKMKNGCI